MTSERKCSECKIGSSANRAGKPGRCVACIDARFRQLGVNPLDPYADGKTARRYACLECDATGEISYAEIRDRDRDRLICDWCSCREMYERGIAVEPSTWDVTAEQAAQIILGSDFLSWDEAGEELDPAGLAARMEHVWEPVLVACIVCGTTTQWSASMTLGCASDLDGARCAHCFSLPGAEWQDQLFTELGLVRDHAGYARFGDPVAAHCADPDCGAERRISITDLKRGVTPCLSCAEAADPDALHAVYKIHFPALRAYKVGITNTEVRHDRIASHVARGGILIEHHEVPNREAARTVEASVLGSVRGFPSGCTSRDFPQGGYTETWSDSGPEIDLADIVEHLTREGAPGFDRLGKLKEYFAAAPASIEELVEFRKIETEEIDGVQVHHLDLSEPLEQVLRKIRARRTAISTTAGT